MTTTQTRPTHAEAVEILFARAVQAQRSLFDAMSSPPATAAGRKALVQEANSALSLYASLAEVHITQAMHDVLDAI